MAIGARYDEIGPVLLGHQNELASRRGFALRAHLSMRLDGMALEVTHDVRHAIRSGIEVSLGREFDDVNLLGLPKEG